MGRTRWHPRRSPRFGQPRHYSSGETRPDLAQQISTVGHALSTQRSCANPPSRPARARAPVQCCSRLPSPALLTPPIPDPQKITSTNTWNLALIDYFHDMSLLRNGDGDNSINFQKASCTLDGCVKIWTSRVDSVATETGKLLSGLAEDGRECSWLGREVVE